MKTVEFHELPSNEQDNLLETATLWLIEHQHLPFTDEAWADDKYYDRIYERAVEMWKESQSEPKPEQEERNHQ